MRTGFRSNCARARCTLLNVSEAGREKRRLLELFLRLSARFREARMRQFLEWFEVNSDTRILDVGGTPASWAGLPVRPRVIIANLLRSREQAAEGMEWVAADGRCLPFRANSFDIVFSNSVIEHVGEFSQQARMASEIRRVGRRYYVQTPNRAFPIEPHLLTPFVHYLPRRWQRVIVPRFTVWRMIARPSRDRVEYYLDHYLRDVRLLNRSRMQELFPDAAILSERFLGLDKSWIAVKR